MEMVRHIETRLRDTGAQAAQMMALAARNRMPIVYAQSTAMTVGIASICNDDGARCG
jgi:long-subunit acyl-CoA synthetase (AMP-forming)